jgi:hypothetical protein
MPGLFCAVEWCGRPLSYDPTACDPLDIALDCALLGVC